MKTSENETLKITEIPWIPDYVIHNWTALKLITHPSDGRISSKFCTNYIHQLTISRSERVCGGKGIIVLFAWYNEGESRLRWYSSAHSTSTYGSRDTVSVTSTWRGHHPVKDPVRRSNYLTDGRNSPRAFHPMCWIYDMDQVQVLLLQEIVSSIFHFISQAGPMKQGSVIIHHGFTSLIEFIGWDA